ncbi:MAG: alpha-glucan family phosphorylase [Acidobacteriota bacterium]|nr:alpha-glucan family phosphorylase [Acidobacteriota bacterium]
MDDELTRRKELLIPSLQVKDLKLPPEVERLQDLAYNLWWTWTPQARRLFASIDRASWGRYRNPIELLLNVDPGHWEALLADDDFMSGYTSTVRSLDAYIEGDGGTWFEDRFPGYGGGPIAYFSMEFGIHQSLAIYSGGLGVLSGDHCKSASDLGLPFVAVGLLYRLGYFRQTVDVDGFQQHIYPEYDFQRLPIQPVLSPRGQELVVSVPLPEREVMARVWRARVGRVPLLLLDTDIVGNDPADRPITNALYVRGREMRLTQEAVLGIGGAKALAALEIEPAAWHINEGHSALLQIERIRAAGGVGGMGSLDAAVRKVGRNTAFTTHTPVPAGNEQFDRDLARKFFDVWAQEIGVGVEELLDVGQADHGQPGQSLNLTAVGVRTSAYVNGVSELNGEVGDRMWRHLRPGLPDGERVVDSITNGIHVPTWLGLEMRNLLVERLGSGWHRALLEPDGWSEILRIPDAEIWNAHRSQKARLCRFSRARLRDQYARHGRSPSELRAVVESLDPDALTVGFARRFATYKRAGLLFSDLHRLRALVNHPERPVQVILAGKAHPADRPGQELIQHIFQLSQEADLKGRVVYLENYDMRIGRMMVQGCDVWLNTPRRPLEASGTSGMKAAINGGLNLSVLDGWWPEAFDGSNGWAIGEQEQLADEWQQDQRDVQSLYQTLEEEVAPRFYAGSDTEPPEAWVQMMKRSILAIGPAFSASRMVRDYAERAYMPLASGSDTRT